MILRLLNGFPYQIVDAPLRLFNLLVEVFLVVLAFDFVHLFLDFLFDLLLDQLSIRCGIVIGCA